MDAALGLLSEHVDSSDPVMKTAAIFGYFVMVGVCVCACRLGLAYAGSCSEEVLEVLMPQVVDPQQSMEVCALSCLALGLVFVGSANEDISAPIVEACPCRPRLGLALCRRSWTDRRPT